MKQIFSKRVRRVLIAAVLVTIVLSIAAGTLGFRLPDITVQTVLQPLRSGAQALTRQAEGIYSYLFRYEALEEQVKMLEAENAQLREEVRAAAALTREVERLTAALGLKIQREDFVLLDAYIIGWDSGDWSEECTINKGSVAGVQLNQCVVTANGEVVGLVTEVGPNYAVVKTVLDSSLEISATVATSGYNGMVQGGYATGEEGYLRMNYLPSDAVICNHDQVVTAGSTLYPRDLVLGSVVDAGFDETGVAKYAILEPAADFGSLEQIFVLTSYATE
ncbi:MAG: rod shape-determining protein MreC [Oscillospiraceae bacterium]|nr:rod shape-determining protein MreC [Oscillospiraceae bacterium]